MKTLGKKRFASFLLIPLLVVMMAVPTRVTAAQPTVNLGTTSSFAILAGETITNTGTTTINGDAVGGGNVGLHPGTAFTGQADVIMTGWTAYLSDPAGVALQAKNDLIIAYDDAAGRTPTIIPTELGGRTLHPGIYASESGTFEITGTLTLDAEGDPEGVFVFQTVYTLITAPDSSVELIGGARFCRTFWKVGSSATLGTDSYFVGHIFALTSIAAQTGATVQGQLLARNGAVTLDTNTITNGICTSTPTAAAAKAAAKAAAAKAAAAKVAAAKAAATTLTGTAGTTISPTTTAATTATNLTGTAGTTVPEGLPDTGESAAGNNMVIGLILLVLAASILTINLRRTQSR